VSIAYGTDSGVYPHGQNARQFAYMVRYGMTPMQAIQSATINAARLLGKEREIGSITRGRFADLIAVPRDPLVEIDLLRHVVGVVKAGVVYRDGSQAKIPPDDYALICYWPDGTSYAVRGDVGCLTLRHQWIRCALPDMSTIPAPSFADCRSRGGRPLGVPPAPTR
jgi:hypothetical protein